jgi:hypothetical protein
MTYNINTYDGLLLTTINDGQVDTTSSSLTLLGKGVTSYGESIAENYIHLLENFARTTAPTNPLRGQFWYHLDANGSGNHVLKVCKSVSPATWTTVGGITSASSSNISGFPASPVDGDIYWDGHQLWVWDNTASTWALIGPMSTPNQNTSVKFDGGLVSDGTAFKNIIKVVVNGKIVAIFSDTSSPFTPVPAFNDGTGATTKFPTIYGGMTLNADFINSTPYAPLNASSQPTTNNSFDLGSNSNRWATVYTTTLDATTIKVGGSSIPVTNLMKTNTANTPTAVSLDLGSPTHPFGSVYAKNLILDDDPGVPASVGDGVFKVPVGTTAQRPASPVAGTLRFNTNTPSFEGYSSSGNWVSLTDQTSGDSRYLQLAGGTLTGALSSSSSVTLTGSTTLTQIKETKAAVTVAANSATIDLSAGTVFTISLTQNITTVTFNNVPSSGLVAGITVFLTQDATGGRTVTWPSSVAWGSANAPSLTSTGNKTDIITMVTYNGGTTWYGVLVGKGF